MIKRQINSLGTITLPKSMRDELGIVGISQLRLDVRESNGVKEIVLRKDDNLEELFKRYKSLAEIISRISECTVSVVWNSTILSMTSNTTTESFVGKDFHIDSELQSELRKMTDDAVVVNNKKLFFLPNNTGEVISYFKIPETGDDRGYYVLLKGTKLDSENKITHTEEIRRFHIIADIVKMQYSHSN